MSKYIVIYTQLGMMNVLKEIDCHYSIDEQLEYYKKRYNCNCRVIELPFDISDRELKEEYNIVRL